ncbi:MAG: STN domain-containing protein [Bacteroides sp.]|nr:STN domain-containing protein [Bacteroides sp.]
MNNSSARVHFKLLLLVCICFLSVATYGQSNVKIVLKGNDITIKEALQEIEKQSKMSVAYNESKLNGTKKVSLDITGQTLEEAMGQVLAGTGYTYQIRNEYIMVVPEKKEQSPIGKNIPVR